MGILDEDIARVRDSTDLVTLIGEKVALRKVGQRYSGLCPFHQEKTPSFSVNPQIGAYYCFGCQKSGDAITFVRETEGLDFVGAVEELAKRSGVTLRYDDKTQAKDKSRKGRLSEAVAAAIDFYHRRLLEAEDGGVARRYLRSRGFDGDAARRFQLGYSPDDWDVLARYLQQEKKLSREDIEGAGLAFVNKANRLQDQFRGRLMFPIYDVRNEAVGFGGRALGDDGPKYKNSPETEIYKKSRLLYALNWAKAEIVQKTDVIICEGYTDVMAFALTGSGNAVATCGTALTDDHVRALKNLTRHVTLAYDADSAGQGAAAQWYKWEQEFELEVRVADLPPGQDPGDLWQEDKPRLVAALEQARPFLQFRVDRAIGDPPPASIEDRSRAAARVSAIVAEHPSDLVRDQYVMQVAGRLEVSADKLRDAVAEAKRNPRPPEPERRRPERSDHSDEAPDGPEPDSGPPPEASIPRRELSLLRWAVHEPGLVSEWLQPELFLHPVARHAFELLLEHADFREALEAADGASRRVLERVAVEQIAAEEFADDERDTVAVRLLMHNVEPAAEKMFNAMLRDGDDRQRDVKLALTALAHAREVGDIAQARELATQLLGWVVHEARARAGAATEHNAVSDAGSPTDERDEEARSEHPEERVEQEA